MHVAVVDCNFIVDTATVGRREVHYKTPSAWLVGLGNEANWADLIVTGQQRQKCPQQFTRCPLLIDVLTEQCREAALMAGFQPLPVTVSLTSPL